MPPPGSAVPPPAWPDELQVIELRRRGQRFEGDRASTARRDGSERVDFKAVFHVQTSAAARAGLRRLGAAWDPGEEADSVRKSFQLKDSPSGIRRCRAPSVLSQGGRLESGKTSRPKPSAPAAVRQGFGSCWFGKNGSGASHPEELLSLKQIAKFLSSRPRTTSQWTVVRSNSTKRLAAELLQLSDRTHLH